MAIFTLATVCILVQPWRILLANAKHSVKQQLLVVDSIIAKVTKDVGSYNVLPMRRRRFPVQMEKDG
jgi:hypothetical protein